MEGFHVVQLISDLLFCLFGIPDGIPGWIPVDCYEGKIHIHLNWKNEYNFHSQMNQHYFLEEEYMLTIKAFRMIPRVLYEHF